MRSNITENNLSNLFKMTDDIDKEVASMLTTEAIPASPNDAIKGMFTSKMFKGVVPDSDLQVIFKKGGQWDKLFGIKKVKQAWDALVSGKTVKKDGPNWKWAG
jgi:hypothetical protein